MSDQKINLKEPLDKIAAMGVIKSPSVGFVYAGMLFLLAGLVLFCVGGVFLFRFAPDLSKMVEKQENIFRILQLLIIPGMFFIAGNVSTYVGIRLLKAYGIVSREVIPRGDYDILEQAIKDGNENAVTQYIRLCSLTGATGFFTKIGLTGLPLATIVLTIILTILGSLSVDNKSKLYDMAQLTLGAFLGSYVQKKREKPE